MAYTVTITGTGDGNSCYVKISDTKYYQATTVSANDGDEIYCYIGKSFASNGTYEITFDGTTISSTPYSAYRFTVSCDVQIDLSYAYYGDVSITITTSEPEGATDPTDGHNTLISGTAYQIESGTVLLGGVEYEIKKGEVLIGGTAYEITFKEKVTVTLTGSMASEYAYAIINGAAITTTGTYEYDAPVSITVKARASNEEMGGQSTIKLNGTKVATGEDKSDYTATYTFESSDKTVNIKFSKFSTSGGSVFAYSAVITTS